METMKKTTTLIIGLTLALALVAALSSATAPNADPVPEHIKALLGQKCSVCHKGKNPPQGLNLEPANVPAALNAPSRQAPPLKLLDTADPEASYLLKKVRRDKSIKGRPMPPGKALTAEEIEALAAWVLGLKQGPAI
jgi:mono/diheme cytochrome c family protein